MNLFSIQIQEWYRREKRDLPWRDTNNPYKIWLSEIIMQQTRVAQGMAYYIKFIETFPQVEDLARADEDQVLRLWQGLGYYSRARNLHHAAKTIVTEFGGNFPTTFKEIKSLKGVGDYSASAIASFAYNFPYAVLDGNVYRLLARYFNDDTVINSSQGKKIFQSYADELLDRDNPGNHNQAIMEMGALVCTPKNPKCDDCPLNESCMSFSNQTMNELPKKEKKVKVKDIYLTYLVYKQGGFTYVQQRKENDIWAKLYEFPLEISESRETFDHFMIDYSSVERIIELPIHKLSHRNVFSKFIEIKVDEDISGFDKIRIDELDDLAKSRLIELYLENSFLFK